MSAIPQLSFAYPREGFPLYADNAVVLGRSEMAHEFVNYLLRPEVSAANAKAAETATCNKGDRGNPVLYPPADVLARTGMARCSAPRGTAYPRPDVDGDQVSIEYWYAAPSDFPCHSP